MKYIFGLPFLRAEEVEDCFIEDLMSIKPNYQQTQKYTDYILNNYTDSEAVFTPNIWPDFKSSTVRTTNA